LRDAVERSRALRIEAAALAAHAPTDHNRRRASILEVERRIDDLYEQVDVFEAAFEAWEGEAAPAAALSARLDQVEAGIADVERELRDLRSCR
jgi:hypothetical protein